MGEGATCIMVESPIKHYPTILKVSPERLDLKAAPCHVSPSQLRRGVLTVAHIAGDDPFPCPSTLGWGFNGNAHFSPPLLDYESPKSICTKCIMS